MSVSHFPAFLFVSFVSFVVLAGVEVEGQGFAFFQALQLPTTVQKGHIKLIENSKLCEWVLS